MAALWVVLLHFQPYLLGLPFVNWGPISRVVGLGYLGVDLFFFLSGFILTHTYANSMAEHIGVDDLRRFAIKRFARIYPVYLVTLVAASILYLAAIAVGHQFHDLSAGDLTGWSFLVNVLAVQQWIGVPSLDGPAWSVSAEFFAYCLFPVSLLAVWRFAARWQYAMCGLIGVYLVYAASLVVSAPDDVRIVQVVAEFSMGMLAYRILATIGPVSERQYRRLQGAVIVALAVSALMVDAQATGLAHAASPVLLGAIVVVGLGTSPGRGLASSGWIALGKWSYSLYLCHRLVQNIASGIGYPWATDSWILSSLQLVAVFIATLGLAYGLYEFVERPARQTLVLRLLGRNQAAIVSRDARN